MAPQKMKGTLRPRRDWYRSLMRPMVGWTVAAMSRPLIPRTARLGVLEPFGRHRQYDDGKDHRIHGEDEAGYPEAEGIQLQ